MHKYVIMGAQGCGKGTQAKLLKERLDLTHISVGDIFRWNIQNHTKLAALVKRVISQGQLVDDDIVEDIIQHRLDEHDWNYGFVLDGFPRNTVQAEFFIEGYDIDAVIHIVISDDVVRRRVMARRLCEDCGLDYNLIHHRPVVADMCDVCGGRLVSRADDTEETLADRLREYHAKTQPVLELFRRKELVIEVDGDQTPQELHAEILSRIGVDS
jgi:adenylate kinase